MNKTKTYILESDELNTLVIAIKNLLQEKHIICLSGTLGAGKTTLTQKILRSLGITEPICSPTYTYMSMYKTASHTIYHFDLYRLSSYHEFVEAGFDEYIADPHAISFIEWPEILIPHLKPNSYITIKIDYCENKRCYTLSY